MSQTRRETPAERQGPIPQELVDRFFDRELDEGSRERFFGMLRADLSRCAEVAKTQRMISMLREPVEAPDLTQGILDRVGRRGGFLTHRLRSMVKAGRLAAAACILFGVLGFAIGRRYAPDFFRFAPEAQPVSQVIESGRNEAAAVIAPRFVVPPAPARPAATPQPRRSFTVVQLEPGKTSVKTLAKPPADDRLVVYLGSGGEGRFSVSDQEVLDRASSTVLPVLSAAAPAEAVLEWLRVLRTQVGVSPVAGAGVPGSDGCPQAPFAGKAP